MGMSLSEVSSWRREPTRLPGRIMSPPPEKSVGITKTYGKDRWGLWGPRKSGWDYVTSAEFSGSFPADPPKKPVWVCERMWLTNRHPPHWHVDSVGRRLAAQRYGPAHHLDPIIVSLEFLGRDPPARDYRSVFLCNRTGNRGRGSPRCIPPDSISGRIPYGDTFCRRKTGARRLVQH